MGEVSGEVAVEGSSGGRRSTLDPIGAKENIALEAWEVEDTLTAGLRQSWITGENDKVEVELDVGAGTGSKWGTFRLTRKCDGKDVLLVFDGSALVESLAAMAERKLVEHDRQTGVGSA